MAIAEPDEAITERDSITTQTIPDQRPKDVPEAPAKDVREEPVKPVPAGLTVASWGGAYAQSQKRAVIKPFESDTGIAVKLVNHRGAFDRLRRENDAGRAEWDVIDLSAAAVDRACREGLLVKIDPGDLAGSRAEAPAKDDFLTGGLHECGVASGAWSSTIVFDRRAFEKREPSLAKDFFDIEKFPGKRALPKRPKYTLELALLADGVDPYYVYRHLESEFGLARAFAMLDRIRKHIVWWESPREPLRLLADNKAEMAIAFNGRVFFSIVRESLPFGVIWDGQIYDLDMWAIPKSSPNREAAMRFIAYATHADRLAEQARWLPYGPMRKSALAKIGKHAETDVEMSPFVPTTEANFKNALRLDTAWWAKHEKALTQRFQVWLKQEAAAETADDAGKTKNRRNTE